MTHRVETQIHCEVPQVILSCNEIVGNDINLQMDNNQNLHTSNNPFKCNICDAILTRKTTFIRHKRRHIEGRKFKCEHCPLGFSGRDDLLQHYRYHYKEGKRFDCMVDSCNSVFKTFRKLSIHLDKDHIIKGSLCKLCSKEFKTERQYFYHLMGFHRDYCMVAQQKPMEQENQSWQHLVQSISPSSTRSDDSYSLSFFHENEEKMSEYSNSMSSGISSPIGFESSFPQSSFFSNLLLSGILSNNNNNIYNSPIQLACTESCDPTLDCMQNANTVNSSPIQFQITKNLICPHCEMQFDNSLLYQVHLACHYPNEPFTCGLCGVQLKDKQTFHYHLAFAEHNSIL